MFGGAGFFLSVSLWGNPKINPIKMISLVLIAEYLVGFNFWAAITQILVIIGMTCYLDKGYKK